MFFWATWMPLLLVCYFFKKLINFYLFEGKTTEWKKDRNDLLFIDLVPKYPQLSGVGEGEARRSIEVSNMGSWDLSTWTII